MLLPFLVLAFSLGYGEKYGYGWQGYAYRFTVGLAWILPRLIFLGFVWWVCLVPFIWVSLFWLSNNKRTSHIFKWQYVEITVGGLVGISYA